MLHRCKKSRSYSEMKAWFTCIATGLFFLYEFFQLNLLEPINPLLRNDFHISSVQLSWISSFFLWGNVLFLLPAGVIIDRAPLRKVLLSMISLCILGTLGFALSHNFLWAAGFRFLTGIGNAFGFLACVFAVSHSFRADKHALVLGCIIPMAFVGGMMAHTPFAHLVVHWGWRGAMIWDVIMGLFFLIIIALVVENPQPRNPIKSHWKSLFKNLGVAAKNSQTWLAGLYTSCINLPMMVICALWGSTYLKTVHHLDSLVADDIINMAFIGTIFGCPLCGWISDHQKLRKPIMFSGAILTGLIIIPLCIDINLSELQLSILFLVLGFATSSHMISYPLIAESNPSNGTASANGLASILIMGLAGLGQILFGWIIHSFSPSLSQATAEGLTLACWMFPIAAVLGLCMVFALRETHCKALKL